jgi:hypothetical protein
MFIVGFVGVRVVCLGFGRRWAAANSSTGPPASHPLQTTAPFYSHNCSSSYCCYVLYFFFVIFSYNYVIYINCSSRATLVWLDYAQQLYAQQLYTQQLYSQQANNVQFNLRSIDTNHWRTSIYNGYQ